MAETNYRRNIAELESKATLWWPDFLTEAESETSIIPQLIETQDQFISILKTGAKSPEDLLAILRRTSIPANVFLKHLVVLADFGGEQIKRLNGNFASIFPERSIKFAWNGNIWTYPFKALPSKGLGNVKLRLDGRGMSKKQELDDLKADMITLLLYGSTCTDDRVAEILEKAVIGSLMGNPIELEKFIKQRYIFVSRITGGAKANALGQVAQDFVVSYLRKILPKDYSIKRNGHVPGITQNDGATLTTFDLVASHKKRHVAIELTFQVTTNSVIERKSGQAADRYKKIHSSGNFIAYVIDGAGNFERKSAVSNILTHSDCSVAYNEKELRIMARFIKERI